MIRERNGIKELSIFWNFKEDKNLPKFKKDSKFGEDGINITSNEGWGNMASGSTEVPEFHDKGKKDNVIIRFFRWIYLSISNDHKKVKSEKDIARSQKTILEFFTSLATNFKHLTPIGEIADHYENALKQAKETGQESLKEKIENIIDVARTESHLIQNGLTEYVTEDQIIDFYEATDKNKNLKLTWIKNFVKVIPTDLVNLKRELDKKELFDNYVILHYDPNNNATNITKIEKEIKKDPILFGLLKNSKKLYYVGDWKDEYCDLTLEGMFTELKEEVLTINNRSLKTYINNAGNYEEKRKKIVTKNK